MKGIKRFKVDTKELSQKEKALFETLVAAAELIAPLYIRQKNERYPGSNFYPPDATVKEIEKAAMKDPAILDPYTFVERDKSNNLVAVPFHIKFKKELKPIAVLLREAADLSENQNFSFYLRTQADSLLDGNYQKSEIAWLQTEFFKIGFVIGPIERYLDKLFFKKCAYQAWVGILNQKKTQEADRFKRIILASQRKILPGSKKVDVSKLSIRVDNTAIFSGLIADFMFTGTNLPNDVNLMERYGSSLTIFLTSLDLKFNQDHLPIFYTVFEKKIQNKYSETELCLASFRCILLHEISHSLIRYRDAEKRLNNFFPVFDELFAYILGIKACGTLILKDAISHKELEAIIIMHIARNFTWWLDSLKNPDVKHYAIGSAIAENFYLKEGAIKEKSGFLYVDLAKVFICINDLSCIMDHYLGLETYEEARKFVKEYCSPSVFKKFLPKLKKVVKKTANV